MKIKKILKFIRSWALFLCFPIALLISSFSMYIDNNIFWIFNFSFGLIIGIIATFVFVKNYNYWEEDSKKYCDIEDNKQYQDYEDLYFENKDLKNYIMYLEAKIDGRLEEFGNSLKGKEV